MKKLRDSRDNRIIDVDTLNFDLRDGNLGTMQYDIRRIYAAGIRTQFEIYRGGGNNLLALIKAPEERPTETEATIDGETTVTIEREEPATTQLNFTVGELLLDKGEIAFTDNTFEKPFRYLISDIRFVCRANQLIGYGTDGFVKAGKCRMEKLNITFNHHEFAVHSHSSAF